MNKSQEFIKLIEEVDSQEQKSKLDKFLSSSKEAEIQDAAIEKFRLKRQMNFMKKYQNDAKNDKEMLGRDNVRPYYWDANVDRITTG